MEYVVDDYVRGEYSRLHTLKSHRRRDMDTGHFSYDALMKFMDWMGEKGLANKQTTSNRKTAAQKVLEALDPSEREDLRDLDREAAFIRFQNLNRSKYTPDSLKVYRSRFSSALDDFLSHANDPSAFKPSAGASNRGTNGTTKNSSRQPKSKSKSKSGPPQVLASPSISVSESGASQIPDSQLTLPIPLRPNLMVKIFGLPADLTQDEARKICAVVSAYATAK